ncbi:helix-turn-helix transcriptional regulator [Leptolyngbya sp. CCNP1308]|uniref:helix-turn-helix transcriptional regulator n=1 Tax=Leptolyngbya sp. CCNP1308 TaxID=3110255 RepID=UPI002B20FFFE|nr:helix-turn-helix transcriptional regulator [Leptolyngbya sp. CCNP1308]MEA5448459.1 helix-turn-helix transcriptional regulator [Leptolyngbya sp. CCNP1308]
MIKNERQYRITKAQIEKFSAALQVLSTQAQEDQTIHPLLKKAEKESLSSQLTELIAETREYEALQAGQRVVLELNSLEELPQALIKARIAAGLTQKDLAERLGLKEQQIQRYENTEYSSVSLARLIELSHALGIQIQEEILLPQSSSTELFKRLKQVGIDQELVLSRFLLTPSINTSQNGESESNLLVQATTSLKRIFGWSFADLFGTQPLTLNPSALGTAYFKVNANANEQRLSVYTVYAHFLALLTLEAVPNLPKRSIPTHPDKVRDEIISTYGELSLRNALKYVWSLGIPVLPLQDSGAFHGAFWRVDGRNVIVLKQKTRSSDRWLLDLVHELWHAAQEPELAERTVIEEGDIAQDRRDSEEERKATKFGEHIQLFGRQKELAAMCASEAGKSIERLKKVVQKVAIRENVSVGALANYMAYRLSLEGVDWWGAAANLQLEETNPWEIARDIFLENVNLGTLNEVDKAILIRALSND